MSKRAFWICAILCLIAALAALAYPIYVIRPFRHQGPRELIAALAVLRYRPWVMAICGFVSIALCVTYWRAESRTSRRIGATVMTVLIVAAAALSRINIYEVMFHPFDQPNFSAAADSKLDGAEKVIAVKLGAVARAYPIRILSYHHIANDLLAGEPIVATY